MLHASWADAPVFQRLSNPSLAHRIADDLRRRIVTGRLHAGRRLPPIRQLARMYGVSIPTVESAMHVLSALGLVRVYRGVGIYVARPPDDVALLNYTWRNADMHELAAIRATIDERAPTLAAREIRSRPPKQQPRVIENVNLHALELALPSADPAAIVRADVAFHRSVLDVVHGLAVGGTLYSRVVARLSTTLEAATALSWDDGLGRAHLHLSAAILDGDVGAATRVARRLVNAERTAVERTLG